MINIIINKISKDPQYFAWYFAQYIAIEKKSLPELLGQLGTDEEHYNRISLCKAPTGYTNDFQKSLKKVADFAEINMFPLLQIIRSVDNVVNFQKDSLTGGATLMAARKKDPHNAEEGDSN